MSDLNSDKGLERALRELVPGPGNLDRDRLMFRAGQVFAPRRNLLWPAATGVLGVLVMILSILLAVQGLTDSRVRLMPAPLQQLAPMIPPADNLAPPAQRPDSEAPPFYDYDETETPGPMHS